MSIASSDFVTVDMRGLKAALVARARAQRVSVSALVRSAVARDFDVVIDGTHLHSPASSSSSSDSATIKLSIRMSPEEVERLAAGAQAAGLSRGAYLAGLVANVPVLNSAGNRGEYIAALIASCAELSTLSRNIHLLTTFLREANVQSAREYRERLDRLAGDVRNHLKLASRVLVDLRPHRSGADAASKPTQ